MINGLKQRLKEQKVIQGADGKKSSSMKSKIPIRPFVTGIPYHHHHHHVSSNSHTHNGNNNNSLANKSSSPVDLQQHRQQQQSPLYNNVNSSLCSSSSTSNSNSNGSSSRTSTGSSSLGHQVSNYYYCPSNHEKRLGDFIRQLKCSGYKELSETCGLSLSELEGMAARQARQLETQDQLLAAKAQRLRYLKSDGEAERLQRLREKVASQEERLRKLRALRGKVQTSRNGNSVLSTDLESLRAVFNEKEKELSVAVAKVDELTRQLEELRKGSRDQYKQVNGQSNVAVELEKLRRELVYRQKLREAQATRVAAQRAALTQRQEEAVRVDRRIAELQERLHRKRLLNHQLAATIKHQENVHDLQNVGIPNKNDPKYQTLPYNTKLFTPFHQQQISGPISSGSNNVQHVNSAKQRQPQTYQQEQIDQQDSFEKSIQQMQQIALESQHQFQNTDIKSVQVHNNNVNNHNSKNNSSNNFANNLHLHQLLSQNLGGSKSASQLMAFKHQQQHQQPQLPNGGYQTTTKLHGGSSSLGVLKGRPVVLGSNDNSAGVKNTVDNNYNNNALQKNSSGLIESVRNIVGTGSSSNGTAATKEMTTCSSGNNFTTTTSSNATGNGNINDSFGSSSSNSSSSSGTALMTNNVLSSIENQNSGSPSSSLKPALPPKPAKPPPPPRGSSSSSSVSSSSDGGNSNINNVCLGLPPIQPDRTELPIKPKPLFPKKGLQYSEPQSTADDASVSGNLNAGYESSESNNSGSNIASENPTVRLSINRRIEMPPAFLFPESDPPPSDLVPDSQPSVILNSNSNSSSVKSGLVTSTSSSNGATTIEHTNPPQLHHQDSGSSLDSVDATAKPLADHQIMHPHPHHNLHTYHSQASSPSLLEEYTLPGVFPKICINNIPPGSSSSSKHSITNSGQSSQSHTALHHQQQSDGNDNVISYLDEHFISPSRNVSSSVGKELNENEAGRSSAGGDTGKLEQGNRKGNQNMSEWEKERNFRSQHELKSIHEFNQLEYQEAVLENGTCNSTSPESNELNGSSDSASTVNSSISITGGEGNNDNNSSISGIIRRAKKGNLKTSNKEHPITGRRVSFDPLALLLDASLEGEFDLVVRTAGEVGNPSAANDEGITALHNGICAGHAEVVRFLVEFGCDVNAQDSDGWTPLHCAASCNNVGMVKFLVERGACIFATTLSDHETAAEKCEEDEDGYGACSEYLYSIQEKLGIINCGVVYAVFDYEAQNPDELSFKEGDRLNILRKGDEFEREWWWASLGEKQGYVPRNLLGLFPRVAPQKKIES